AAPAAAAHVGRRSVSATSNSAAPVPGDQGVGMDPGKQQQQHKPHAPAGEQQGEDVHKTTTAHGYGRDDPLVRGGVLDEVGRGGVRRGLRPERPCAQPWDRSAPRPS
uniref:Uncharacterized protein n=1 Tax=Aegilops tauschii subsp. strangulata TaxID=200361 RepID=A0A453H8T8_AEGTS